MHGGTYQLAGMPATFECENRASLRKLLATFSRNMRSVMQLSLPDESLSFFKPSKAAELRLEPLGFSNYSAAMCGTISNLTLEQTSILAKCLIGFRHSFTRNSTKLFHDGVLRLRPVKLSLRSPLNITHNSKFAFLDLPTVVSILSQLADEPVACQPSTFDILCPKCGALKEAAHIGLRFQGKWNSISCKSKNCLKHSTSRQWLCVCHLPWHSCPRHAIIGNACGGKERLARSARDSSERTHFLHAQPTQSPVNGTGGASRGAGSKHKINRKRDQGFQISTQLPIAKRLRAIQETGIPSTFLSAKLARRFSAHVRNIADVLPTQASVRESELN